MTASYSTQDLARVLIEEMPNASEETGLYAAITGSGQLMLRFIRELIAADDVASLSALCNDQTPLHELLTRRSPRVANVEGADRSPTRDSSRPLVNALRGIAALGLALVDDEPAAAQHLKSALRWLDRAHICVSATTPVALGDRQSRHAERVGHLVDLLNGDELAITALVWMLELDGADRAVTTGPKVDILLDRGGSGTRATLRCTVLRNLPSALLPDPRSMAFFSADERFASGLRTAWAQGGRRIRGTVVWSLDDPDGPIDRVTDISLTAAFTVLLDEVRRTRRRLIGPFTVRRIATRTAVVGGVDEDGRMVSVAGYRSKFSAAGTLDRVIVPNDDLPAARGHADGAQFQIIGVDTWEEAARASRRLNRRYVLRVTALALAMTVLLSSGGVWLWWKQNQIHATQDTAARVAATATQLANGDSDGLALLLAMASDDIAASAGQTTNTFDSLARNNSTLVRILRPQHGRYEEPVISGDGAFALLSTSAGTVQLVSTAAGQVRWQHDYPPGLELSSQQIQINGLAFSPKGREAAFATSDLKITLLAPSGQAWAPSGTLALPVTSKPGPLNVELNAVKALQFTPDGTSLVAYGERSGLFRYDLSHPAEPPKRCTAPNDAVALAVGSDGALLVRPHEITKVDLGNCSTSTVMTAPEGATWQTAVIQTDGVPAGFATRGSQLLVYRPGQSEVLISDRGPYSQVHATVSSDDVHVSASTNTQTVGWQLNHGAQEFGLRAPGVAAASVGDSVWVHNGIAEILDRGHTPAALKAVRFIAGQSVAWAGPDLVIRRFVNVFVAPGGAAGLTSSETRRLNSPAGASITELATSPSGPWAAAIADDKKARKQTVLAWDVPSGRQLQVTAVDNDVPTHVAFSDGDLFVSYYHGDVRRFRLHGDHWEQTGSVRLPAPAAALGSRDGADSIYAVVSDSSGAAPSVVKIRKSDLAVVATVHLTGPTGLARLAVLQDTQVVVGYGEGQVAFLDPQLSVRGTYTDGELSYVLDVAEVPGFDQVIVSGRAKSIVLDRVTRTPQAGVWERGGPFTSASASSDGRVLATYNYFDSEMIIWSLSKPDLRRRVCQAVGRDLTPQEWATFIGPNPAYHPVCAQ